MSDTGCSGEGGYSHSMQLWDQMVQFLLNFLIVIRMRKRPTFEWCSCSSSFTYKVYWDVQGKSFSGVVEWLCMWLAPKYLLFRLTLKLDQNHVQLHVDHLQRNIWSMHILAICETTINQTLIDMQVWWLTLRSSQTSV